MKNSIAFILLLNLCVLLPHAARAQGSAKLSLASIEGHVGMVSDNSNRPVDLVVLIENTSSRDIGIYRQWNSRGYYSLHFVAEGSDGKQTVIRKSGGLWTMNFPDCFGLPPGMTHAIPVCFTLKDWQDVDALSAKGAKLKAVFQQEPFPESYPRKPDFQILTNKIESAFVSWDILTRKSSY